MTGEAREHNNNTKAVTVSLSVGPRKKRGFFPNGKHYKFVSERQGAEKVLPVEGFFGLL
jgi:guanylate kinase